MNSSQVETEEEAAVEAIVTGVVKDLIEVQHSYKSIDRSNIWITSIFD